MFANGKDPLAGLYED